MGLSRYRSSWATLSSFVRSSALVVSPSKPGPFVVHGASLSLWVWIVPRSTSWISFSTSAARVWRTLDSWDRTIAIFVCSVRRIILPFEIACITWFPYNGRPDTIKDCLTNRWLSWYNYFLQTFLTLMWHKTTYILGSMESSVVLRFTLRKRSRKRKHSESHGSLGIAIPKLKFLEAWWKLTILRWNRWWYRLEALQ